MSRIWEHRRRDEITISADCANKTGGRQISCCIGRLEFLDCCRCFPWNVWLFWLINFHILYILLLRDCWPGVYRCQWWQKRRFLCYKHDKPWSWNIWGKRTAWLGLQGMRTRRAEKPKHDYNKLQWYWMTLIILTIIRLMMLIIIMSLGCWKITRQLYRPMLKPWLQHALKRKSFNVRTVTINTFCKSRTGSWVTYE